MNGNINSTDGQRCGWCPGVVFHLGGKCPLVSAYEYFPNGTIKRVEFYSTTKTCDCFCHSKGYAGDITQHRCCS